jgi:hypothetical protein
MEHLLALTQTLFVLFSLRCSRHHAFPGCSSLRITIMLLLKRFPSMFPQPIICCKLVSFYPFSTLPLFLGRNVAVKSIGLVRRLTILLSKCWFKLHTWRRSCPYVSISDRWTGSIFHSRSMNCCIRQCKTSALKPPDLQSDYLSSG